MSKKENRTAAADSLSFKVPSLAGVDGARLAKIKRPPQVKALVFYPRRPVDGLHALLQKNIPPEYMARLVYIAPKRAIRVPTAAVACPVIKLKPFRSRAEMVIEFKRTVFPSFVKLYYPKKLWRKKLAKDCRYLEKAVPNMGFRLVRGGSTAALMVLLDWKYKEKPVTLVAWVWLRKTLTLNERRYAQRLMLDWLRGKTKRAAVAGVDTFNPASQGFFRKAGFSVDCLRLSVPRPTLINTPGVIPYLEWAAAYNKMWKAVTDADYKKAIDVLTPLYRKYPRDFKVVKTYAMVLGDYADGLTGGLRPKLKRKSLAILRKLTGKLGNVRWEWNISTRNEYYYHSGQFRKQYELGLESAAGGHKWGYYGQGVGAANYSYEHAAAGRRGYAALWARRAISSWENFFKFKDDYYNAYVHYALAFGILGRLKEMEAALKKSAALSGKPHTYREFAEVREKILKLGDSRQSGDAYS